MAGVNPLLKFATLLKLTLLHGSFSCFLNCTNGTKLRNASEISEFFLISFVGMPLLCVALFALRLLISSMISSYSTWEKAKDKLELQFSFITTMLVRNLYFIIAFISGLPMMWLPGSFSLYWGIPRFVMILKKNSFQTDAVFL